MTESRLPLATRKKRLLFRASHRGVKEADILIGGFVAREIDGWGHGEIAWFEHLLEETDRDILAWVTGSAPVPPVYDTPIMKAMQRLDYLAAQG